ncbi:hypothetical protein INS49_005421 [Diaporthe citri]|uniref:uncharacterized protein n=1 Tax=Diaporthe citri TaxID=83186 RepID=UPI001C80A010|nr:uncharacterized protein INS49_005421 [Diaporthe citri]KAG6353712.1 hypothetical protein INS49_005421 [Diaporthe citri]
MVSESEMERALERADRAEALANHYREAFIQVKVEFKRLGDLINYLEQQAPEPNGEPHPDHRTPDQRLSRPPARIPDVSQSSVADLTMYLLDELHDLNSQRFGWIQHRHREFREWTERRGIWNQTANTIIRTLKEEGRTVDADRLAVRLLSHNDVSRPGWETSTATANNTAARSNSQMSELERNAESASDSDTNMGSNGEIDTESETKSSADSSGDELAASVEEENRPRSANIQTPTRISLRTKKVAYKKMRQQALRRSKPISTPISAAPKRRRQSENKPIPDLPSPPQSTPPTADRPAKKRKTYHDKGQDRSEPRDWVEEGCDDEHDPLRPPRFWDNLSHVPLVLGALEELDRRNNQVAAVSRQEKPVPIDCSLPRYARFGGPDLSDLRGFEQEEEEGEEEGEEGEEEMPRDQRGGGSAREVRGGINKQRRSTRGGRLTASDQRTKSSSPYDPAFQQHLTDHRVWPMHYWYEDGGEPPPPDNFQDISTHVHGNSRASLEPETFTAEDFGRFNKAYHMTTAEEPRSRTLDLVEGVLSVNTKQVKRGPVKMSRLYPLTPDQLRQQSASRHSEDGVEYITSKVGSWFLDESLEDLRKAAGAFRNGLEWAQKQLDEAIDRANRRLDARQADESSSDEYNPDADDAANNSLSDDNASDEVASDEDRAGPAPLPDTPNVQDAPGELDSDEELLYDGNVAPPEFYRQNIRNINVDDFKRRHYAKGTLKMIENAQNYWQSYV